VLEEPSPARSVAALVVATGLPAFMLSLDNMVVTTALPTIQRDFAASIEQLQWTVDVYTLPFAALILAAATVGDRVGRRQTFTGGLLPFVLASAAAGLATSPTGLIAARAVQGVGAAAVLTLSLTLLATGVPPRSRALAVGLWGAFSGLGVALGPILGGAAVSGLHWPWIFLLNVPVGLATLVVVRLALPESTGPATRLDPLGIALSAAGLVAVVWGVVAAPTDGWTSPTVLAALVGGGALLLAFAAWQRRAPHPLLPPTLFRAPVFRIVNGVALLSNTGLYGCVFLITQYFQVEKGLSAWEAGLHTVPCTVPPLFVAPFAGVLTARFGLRRLMVVGHTLVALSLAAMTVVFATSGPYPVLATAFLVCGTGLGLTYPAVSSLALTAVPASAEGIASGVIGVARELGVAVGVAVLVSLFASYGDYRPGVFVDGLVPASLAGIVVIGTAALLSTRLPDDHAASRLSPSFPPGKVKK